MNPPGSIRRSLSRSRPQKTLTTLAIHRVDQLAYRFEFRKVSEFLSIGSPSRSCRSITPSAPIIDRAGSRSWALFHCQFSSLPKGACRYADSCSGTVTQVALGGLHHTSVNANEDNLVWHQQYGRARISRPRLASVQQRTGSRSIGFGGAPSVN
jgi:hypothetical protein